MGSAMPSPHHVPTSTTDITEESWDSGLGTVRSWDSAALGHYSLGTVVLGRTVQFWDSRLGTVQSWDSSLGTAVLG